MTGPERGGALRGDGLLDDSMEEDPALLAWLAVLGRRVRQARAVGDLSVAALAKATGIPERRLSEVEAGRGDDLLNTQLWRLADVLRVPITELTRAPAERNSS